MADHITGSELYEARRRARLDLHKAAKICGLHPSTLRRQEAGDSRASLCAFHLFLAMAGEFPGSQALAGWGWDSAGLWTPEGMHVTPGEIRALPYLHQLISELERQTQRPQTRPKTDNVRPLPLPNRGIT